LKIHVFNIITGRKSNCFRLARDSNSTFIRFKSVNLTPIIFKKNARAWCTLPMVWPYIASAVVRLSRCPNIGRVIYIGITRMVFNEKLLCEIFKRYSAMSGRTLSFTRCKPTRHFFTSPHTLTTRAIPISFSHSFTFAIGVGIRRVASSIGRPASVGT
jgi:hypothetical protein